MGLHGKVLIAGVASVISFQKFPPCPAEPVSASSKRDPWLAKADPIHSGGSTSGIRDLGRERSYCTTAVAARERNERNRHPAQ